MNTITPDKPVLIAGPTASGKSALALHIARAQGGIIINADALQVFDGWRLLTARPSDEDLKAAEHALYGHIPFDAPYSVGHWLRDVKPYLSGPIRPIIVGGTGLYFNALTKGLADIPAIPETLRTEANGLPLSALLDELDETTKSRIDLQNRMRVQRAWEVARHSGRSLASWQDATPPPLLAPREAICITLNAPKDWLNPRIERRFDQMLDQGALVEAQTMLPNWNPAHASSKAIGAPELIGHLQGQYTLSQAREAAIIATRQYAKRQRTWFRARHKHWAQLDCTQNDIAGQVVFDQRRQHR